MRTRCARDGHEMRTRRDAADVGRVVSSWPVAVADRAMRDEVLAIERHVEGHMLFSTSAMPRRSLAPEDRRRSSVHTGGWDPRPAARVIGRAHEQLCWQPAVLGLICQHCRHNGRAEPTAEDPSAALLGDPVVPALQGDRPLYVTVPCCQTEGDAGKPRDPTIPTRAPRSDPCGLVADLRTP